MVIVHLQRKHVRVGHVAQLQLLLPAFGALTVPASFSCPDASTVSFPQAGLVAAAHSVSTFSEPASQSIRAPVNVSHRGP